MEKKTLKQIVYKETLKDILEGKYDTVQVLNEQTLITRFGYSKSPIREALVMLCNEGVLRSIPRYGYEIVRFSSKEIMELLKYRQILECGLLRISIEKITPEQIEKLKDIQNNSYPVADDMTSRWENNQLFHTTLAKYADNEYAYQELLSAMKLLRVAFSKENVAIWTGHSRTRDDIDPHDTIIECIEMKNLEKAEEALAGDLLTFPKIY